MTKTNETSQKAQQLTQEELENVNGGRKTRNGLDDAIKTLLGKKKKKNSLW